MRAGGGRSPARPGREEPAQRAGAGPGSAPPHPTPPVAGEGKGSEAQRRPCGKRVTGAAAASSRSAAPLLRRRAAHPAWRRDPPGFLLLLLLPHRCHLVRAAAEAGARTLPGAQAKEAARHWTGAANRFSAAPLPPSLLPPAAFLAGLPRGALSTRAVLLQPTPELQSPPHLSPSSRRPNPIPCPRSLLSRVAPARVPGCPGDPRAAPPLGTPSVPAVPTPRDARFAHRRIRARPAVPPPLSRFSSFCSPLPTWAAAPPGPRAGGWAGPRAARRPIAGKGVWGGSQWAPGRRA